MPSAIRQIPLDNAIKHHAHDFHQMVIGLSGHAEFEIEGMGGSIAALSGCIVPANHVHYYEGIGENRQLILDLPLDAPSLTGSNRELARLFDAPRFFALDEPLRHYLDFVTQELNQPYRCLPGESRPHGELLVTTLLDCLHARLHPELPTTKARRRELDLTSLNRFIQHNLGQRLSVADLAAEACLSVAHFSDCFRAQTGLSPYQYLLRQRLDAARHLLTSSRLPLSEIAAHTGFANQSALSHAFRRAFDQPPSALRRSSAINEAPHGGNRAHLTPRKTIILGNSKT
ncbi:MULTISPECIES: AraC family transcriptional regulator [Halomonadaceae]|uniref:AraC family transcriptional regulator n=1 Tax=Halomonadaceae TaxID=28256 RepID=UPI00159A850F|nr:MULTISPECIES: AraC family transcriptional regulator [Halomonas]QJQ95303.1 helix-turn-helix transcriptional regulator [Halomonas sp. PA5]